MDSQDDNSPSAEMMDIGDSNEQLAVTATSPRSAAARDDHDDVAAVQRSRPLGTQPHHQHHPTPISPKPWQTDIDDVLSWMSPKAMPLMSPRFLPLVDGDDQRPTHDINEQLMNVSRPSKPTVETREPQTSTILEVVRIAGLIDKLMLCVAILLSVGLGLLLPLTPPLYGQIFQAFQQYTDGTGLRSAFLPTVAETIVTLLIIAACIFILYPLSTYLWMVVSYRVHSRIISRYFETLLREDIAWFDTTQSLPSIVSSSQNFHHALAQHIGTIVRCMATAISSFVWALLIDWRLALVCMTVVPVISLSGLVLKRQVEQHSREQMRLKDVIVARVVDVVRDIRTVLAYGGQREEQAQYDQLVECRQVVVKKMLSWNMAFLTMVNFLTFASFALIYWYGGELIADGTATGAAVISVFLLTSLMFQHVFRAGTRFSDVFQGFAELKPVLETIQRGDTVHPSDDGYVIDQDEFRGECTFTDVHFAYPSRPDTQVLKGFSLYMDEGTVTALIGESGCGKSTVTQLLSRLYSVNSGSIVVDGRDIAQYNRQWLRRQVAVATQDARMFDMSIEENLQLADVRRKISMDEVVKVCKAVGIHEFVKQLPAGYETRVSGVSLSGGQAQRLSLARALLKPAKVLILDETTSHLDEESTSRLWKSIKPYFIGKTVLIITHRVQSLGDGVDKICIVRSGQIAEQGIHDELRELKGIYSSMVDLKHTSSKGSSGTVVASSDALPNSSAATSQQIAAADNADPSSTHTVRRTLKFAKYSRFAYWMTILFAALDGLVTPAYAYVFTLTLSTYATSIRAAVADYGLRNALLFLLLAGCKALFAFLRAFFAAWTSMSISTSLRKRGFASVLVRAVEWFDRDEHQPSVIASRLADDPSVIHQLTLNVIPNVAESLVTCVVGLTLAFVASWRLALLTLVCFPVILVANRYSQRVSYKFSKRSARRYERVEQLTKSCLTNVRTVKLFNLEDYFAHRAAHLLSQNTRAQHVHGIVSGLGAAVGVSIVFACEALVFYVAALLVQARDLTFPNAIMVFTAAVFSSDVLTVASQISPDLVRIRAACARILSLLMVSDEDVTHESEQQDDGGDNELEISTETNSDDVIREAKIKFKDVSFAYPARADRLVLTSLNLTIPAKQTWAIVGTSGVGKSTLFQLLEGFYQPLAGTIRIDDKNIRRFDQQALRRQIAYVTQTPTLFNRSIVDNIRYGSENSSLEEVQGAARLANIHEFIMSLREKYDTMVGLEGVQLSGGQRQRIAIARAMLRRPKILLLDEYSSAIDVENQRAIQQSLSSMKHEMTILIIAHRLSTVLHADKIVVLSATAANGDAATVSEIGKHRELIANRGEYYRLFEIQQQQQQQQQQNQENAINLL